MRYMRLKITRLEREVFMKVTKKFVAVLLTFVFVLTSFSQLTFASQLIGDDGNIVDESTIPPFLVSLLNASLTTYGYVDVPISITRNRNGINSFEVELDFDSSQLELVSVTREGLGLQFNEPTTNLAFRSSTNQGVHGTGTLAIARFRILGYTLNQLSVDLRIVDIEHSFVPEGQVHVVDSTAVASSTIVTESIRRYIGNENDLRNMSRGPASVGVTYILKNDIDLTQPWIPINDFRGTLDGQGNSINNLFIPLSSNRTDAALFGLVTEGHVVIKNLGVYIGSGGIHSSLNRAGGLVAMIHNSSTLPLVLNTSLTILDSYVVGDIYSTGIGGNRIVGGLVGGSHHGATVTIERSFFAGNLTVYVTGEPSRSIAAGGLFGLSDINVGGHVSVNDSFANVNISVTRYKGDFWAANGGLIGASGADGVTMINSYATGRMSLIDGNHNSVRRYSRDLIGRVLHPYVITNVYDSFRVDNFIHSQGYHQGLQSPSTPLWGQLSPEQMRDQSYLPNWDFTNVWQYANYINAGFPILRTINPNFPIMFGDVTGDSVLTHKDTMYFRRSLMNYGIFYSGRIEVNFHNRAEDFNQDGYIDRLDYDLLNDYVNYLWSRQ